ncbi:hypothetical protein IE077_001602 [Cardiosporidium cionae]|uniref:Uncharacterized protein n=1 Tax=Cardiosporidium cionae TaxID=476202 RepID=A0ABQ7JDQ0_9APIC|nr:hypothetical protein IE077_001602 [Cardiosporidium cionae]|eukprot:KAF8821770.1 hypothetical protein IE077_001602 [Cardiosporidium cionae]
MQIRRKFGQYVKRIVFLSIVFIGINVAPHGRDYSLYSFHGTNHALTGKGHEGNEAKRSLTNIFKAKLFAFAGGIPLSDTLPEFEHNSNNTMNDEELLEGSGWIGNFLPSTIEKRNPFSLIAEVPANAINLIRPTNGMLWNNVNSVLPSWSRAAASREQNLSHNLSTNGSSPLFFSGVNALPGILVDTAVGIIPGFFRVTAIDGSSQHVAASYMETSSFDEIIKRSSGEVITVNSDNLDADSLLKLLSTNSTGTNLAALLQTSEDQITNSHILSSLLLPPVAFYSRNNFTANSSWPVPHRSGYSQGSSLNQCFDGRASLTHNFLNSAFLISNPITLLYTDDEKYVWGSSWTTIFKIDRSQNELRIVDFVVKPMNELLQDKFHGAYSILTKEGIFIVSTVSRMEAYNDVPGSNGEKIMKNPIFYSLTDDIPSAKPNEAIRSLCMTHDGFLAWTTDRGRVGIHNRVIDEGFKRSIDWLQLGNPDEPLEVSNSIACDEEGGIYIVSSRYMHKAVWNGTSLQIAWEVAYGKSLSRDSVRLGKGSGSTPSIMGSGTRKFVVITDDSTIMNVVILDASTGELKDKKPVTFGNPSATRTLSEQSVLVNGWRLVVVNNTPREDVTSSLLSLGNPATFLAEYFSFPVSRISSIITSSWPVIVGDAPKGIEQMIFNPNTGRLSISWINTDVSIPNGIPTMSASTGILYGIGKRGAFGVDAAPFRGMWTLEALDWWTGKEVFYYNIAIGPFANSIYAATEIGPNEIITGTAAGVVRIRRRQV